MRSIFAFLQQLKKFSSFLFSDRAVYTEKICITSLELLSLLWNQTIPELKLFFQEKLYIFGQILPEKGKTL
jgi:hypothetical protein